MRARGGGGRGRRFIKIPIEPSATRRQLAEFGISSPPLLPFKRQDELCAVEDARARARARGYNQMTRGKAEIEFRERRVVAVVARATLKRVAPVRRNAKFSVNGRYNKELFSEAEPILVSHARTRAQG